MNRISVSTEEFWQKMCDLKSYRVSLHEIAIGNDLFMTETAPEQVPGFLEAVVDSIVSGLNLIPIPLEQDTLLA